MLGNRIPFSPENDKSIAAGDGWIGNVVDPNREHEVEEDPVLEEVVGVAGLVGRMIEQFSRSPSSNDSFNNNNSAKASRLRKSISPTVSPTKTTASAVNGFQTRPQPLDVNVNGHHTTLSLSPSFRQSPNILSAASGVANQTKASPNPLTVRTNSVQTANRRAVRTSPVSPASCIPSVTERQFDENSVTAKPYVQTALTENNRRYETNGVPKNTGSKILQSQSARQKENDITSQDLKDSDHGVNRVVNNNRVLNGNRADIIQNNGPVLNDGTRRTDSKIENGYGILNGDAAQVGIVREVGNARKKHSNGSLTPALTTDAVPVSSGSQIVEDVTVISKSSPLPQSHGDSQDHVEASTPDSNERDGNYYLRLIEIETNRLNGLKSVAERDLTTSIPEEASGRVRATVGKATLLTTKKFNQFRELCHKNLTPLEDDAFKTTCGDLAGFWDLILIQIDDVNRMFSEIDMLRTNGWDESKIFPGNEITPLTSVTVTKSKHSEVDGVTSPGVKVISNGAHKTSSKSPAAAGTASKAQEEARRRLMAAKRAGRQRKASNEDEEIQIFAR